MRRFLVLFVGMVLGAAITFVMVGSMRKPPRFPEEAVSRALELLRDGHVEKLRACMSDPAWSVIAEDMPGRDDAEGLGLLRRFMFGYRGVRVEAASYSGDQAVVEAVIDLDQGPVRETFRLVRSGETWLLGAAPEAGEPTQPPRSPQEVDAYLQSAHAAASYGFVHRAALEALVLDHATDAVLAPLAGNFESIAAAADPATAQARLLATVRMVAEHSPDELVRRLGHSLISEGAVAYRANADLFRLAASGQSLDHKQRLSFVAAADGLERIELGRALVAASSEPYVPEGTWETERQAILRRVERQTNNPAASAASVAAAVAESLDLAQAGLAVYPPWAAHSDRLAPWLGRVRAVAGGGLSAAAAFAGSGAGTGGGGGGGAGVFFGELIAAPGADMGRSGHFRTAALRTLSGVRFTYQTDTPIRGQPVVGGGVAYLPLMGRYRWEGSRILALDLATRQPAWTFNAPARASSITLVGGRVYVVCGDPGTAASTLVALDAATGGRAWAFEAPGGADNLLSHPVVDGASVCVTDRSGALFALDPRTGAVRWQREGGRVAVGTAPTPALADGIIYVPMEREIIARDANGGEVLWRRDETIRDGAVAVQGERLYLCHRRVLALSTASGSESWSFDEPETGVLFRGAPAIAGGRVFARDGRNVYALDESTGQLLWTVQMPGPLDWNVAPVVSQDVVYVGTEGSAEAGSTIYAFDAATGTELWTHQADSRLYGAAPVVADGVVYVAAGEVFFALE